MPSAPTLPILDNPSASARFPAPLTAARRITTLQVNLGLVCNLACHHCHVESSPKRNGPEENMSAATAERILTWLAAQDEIRTVDLTGGSPEMNPQFRRIVVRCRELGRHVMDRCNPTIISYVDGRTGQGYDWVPQFLADHEVEVVASMPCYLEDNVDAQRGRGAYHASIDGLRRLNDVGYGRDARLRLNLVYNPNGPHLPPLQESLAADYRRELKERFGLEFNELWTIANMPIRRWRERLARNGQLESYMRLLMDAYNPATVEGLMCRHQIHVDSQGRVFDCDFNYALGLGVPGFEQRHLWDLTAGDLAGRRIATADHCYGCTAGAGSSCGGALV